MNIAFDAQLLFETQKTGIGWNAKMMIDRLTDHREIEWTLNCFRRRDAEETERILAEYREKGCRIRESRWMPGRIYNHLERMLPLPYRWIFGKDADITQFFNYTVPFGAAGEKITIVHDMAYMAFPETVAKRTRRWLQKGLRSYCERADLIVTVSEFSKTEIQHYLGISPKKIRVIYNGVDLKRYRPDYSEPEIAAARGHYGIPRDYLLYLGTLEPRKNIECLITAYWNLKKEMPGAPKLVLAGKKGWLYDSIFELVKDYGLMQDVIFTGYVAEIDTAPLLCGADMFLFPSLYEGFGIPPLEAMACGTPVITSNTSSLPEVVGNAGIMVPPKDTDALKEQMKALLQNRALREKLRAAGPEQAGKFTWERSAEQLIAVYKEVLNEA